MIGPIFRMAQEHAKIIRDKSSARQEGFEERRGEEKAEPPFTHCNSDFYLGYIFEEKFLTSPHTFLEVVEECLASISQPEPFWICLKTCRGTLSQPESFVELVA